MMHNSETQSESNAINLGDAAGRLGAAVVATAEYQAFKAADERFRNDPQAQELLGQFREAQQTLQLMRQLGSDTTEETLRLQNLQESMEASHTITGYSYSQEKLITVLRELNEFISNRLNLDFAGLTKPQRGCCG